jgi:hypothetical protein
VDAGSVVSLSVSVTLLVFAGFLLYRDKRIGGFLLLLFGFITLLLSTPSGNRIHEMIFQSKVFGMVKITMNDTPAVISATTRQDITKDVREEISRTVSPKVTLEAQEIESSSSDVTNLLTEQVLNQGLTASNPFSKEPFKVGTVFVLGNTGIPTAVRTVRVESVVKAGVSGSAFDKKVPGSMPNSSSEVTCENSYIEEASQTQLLESLRRESLTSLPAEAYIVARTLSCGKLHLRLNTKMGIPSPMSVDLRYVIVGYKAFRIRRSL